MMDTCPACGADLRDGTGSRVTGNEVRGVYDGVLYWSCPDCNHAWPRDHGSVYRNERAQHYVDLHNGRN